MDGRVQNTRCFGSCPDQATTGATFSWHVVDVVIDADNEHGDGDDGDNDDVMVMVDRGYDNGHEDEDEDDDGMFRLGIETTTILEGGAPLQSEEYLRTPYSKKATPVPPARKKISSTESSGS